MKALRTGEWKLNHFGSKPKLKKETVMQSFETVLEAQR